MPANFNGPYAVAPKAPGVIAADKKAVVAEKKVDVAKAALDQKKAVVAVAAKKDAVAVKALAATKPLLAAAVKSDTVADSRVVGAQKALAPAKNAVITALKAKLRGTATKQDVTDAYAARALAEKNLEAASIAATSSQKRVIRASTQVVAKTRAVVATKTATLAAATSAQKAAEAVVVAKEDVAVAKQGVAVATAQARTLSEARVGAAEKKLVDAKSDVYRHLKGRVRGVSTKEDVADAYAAKARAEKHLEVAKETVALETKLATETSAKAIAARNAVVVDRKTAGQLTEEANAAKAKAIAAQKTHTAASTAHAAFVAKRSPRP
jgi:hypothetical protein